MLKYYVKASDLLERLRADQDGVVSFEYLIVAACIIAAVGAAYSATGAGTIGGALTAGINLLRALSIPPSPGLDTALTPEGGHRVVPPPPSYQTMVAMSATFHPGRRDSAYAEVLRQDPRPLERLRADKDGVVSFEYIIVAACHRRRSGHRVRYWRYRCYRGGADGRDRHDRRPGHCGQR